MKAVILTEGGKRIGFGHITRCRALQDAFRKRGVSVSLAVNGDDLVRRHFRGQFACVFDWLKDTKRLAGFLKKADIVIIDSYLAPLDFYQKLACAVPGCVFIDDFKRLRYPTGIVVNPAIGAEKFGYPNSYGARYLLGAKFALLRKEFWDIPRRKVRRHISDVLVTFGGIDRPILIRKMLGHLKSAFPDWRFHVVTAGPVPMAQDPQMSFLTGLTAGQMKRLMLRCDAAVSGGGQTLNELAVCGVPVIGVCFAENQRGHLRGWRMKSLLKYAGVADQPDIFQCVCRLLGGLTWTERRRISAASQKMIDGRGVFRVASELMKQPLSFRPVCISDRRRIFGWANDPNVRTASFHEEKICWKDHCEWFQSKLKSKDHIFEMILWFGRPAGQVRFESCGTRATISISIAKECRKKGIGRLAIRSACSKLFQSSRVQRVDAYIKTSNKTSVHTFKEAGFCHMKETEIAGRKAYHLILRKEYE